MKNIIVDAYVPYIGDIFSGIASVTYLPPAQITPDAVADADALIVRTRTRCDAALLAHSRVSFVGTATIGTDHLDLPWLASLGIRAVNAPGCNAPAVAQYVLASILTIHPSPQGLTLGVVGVGHVGRIVAAWASALGMNVLLCDPPRAAAEGPAGFTSLADIAARADIITLHTPHTKAPAPYPTHHLADARFFASLRRKPVVINAARGPVVDNAALITALRSGTVSHAVLDCWEGEPNLDPALLAAATIATPHIAGYSIEGKQRATQTVVNHLLEHLGATRRLDLGVTPSAAALTTIPSAASILASYRPLDDTAALRSAPSLPTTFESLRNHYPLRHEPHPSATSTKL